MSTLLQHLSSVEAVSGEHLASVFGCSRAAINKQIAHYRDQGVLIEARPRQGYRLGYAYEWLRQEPLERAHARHDLPVDIHVLPHVDSTNTWVMSALHAAIHTPMLAATDFQQAGRGRRGRSWLAPAGRQLTASWGLCSEAAPLAWMGVALAVGAAVAEVLRQHDVPVQLKWPNDLVIEDAKLGGLLVEMEAVMDGASRVVVGLGLNEHLFPQEVVALQRDVAMLSAYPVKATRHELLAELSAAVLGVLATYPEQGLAPWLSAWASLDALAGRRVRFQQGAAWLEGTARGIDETGRLRVMTADGEVACHSGEVSVHVA